MLSLATFDSIQSARTIISGDGGGDSDIGAMVVVAVC